MEETKQLDRRSQHSDKLAYSVTEVATSLGLSPSSIWKLISLSKLKAIRVGRRTVVPRSELDRILANGI